MSFNPRIKGLAAFFGASATAAAAFVAFSLPNVALAQEGSAGALLEEIVTTARKKSSAEAVQDVPVAVTAFGAAQLDALVQLAGQGAANCLPFGECHQAAPFACALTTADYVHASRAGGTALRARRTSSCTHS